MALVRRYPQKHCTPLTVASALCLTAFLSLAVVSQSRNAGATLGKSLSHQSSRPSARMSFRKLFARTPQAVPAPAAEGEEMEPLSQRFRRSRDSRPAVVIGAGVSGLTCAQLLKEKNFNVTVLEASDGVGGRVRTDDIDGFKLDRGFQVFLDEYPDVRDYFREAGLAKLNLKKFQPGALVYRNGAFNRVADPLRRPQDLVSALTADVGSLVDKFKVGAYKIYSNLATLETLNYGRETDTYTFLKEQQGLSDDMIDQFFRPFMRGIYLSELEDQSSHMFNFIFKVLADGSATLPENGLGAVSDQLAVGLQDRIRLNTPVKQVSEGKVTLASGEEIDASYIVIATDGASASKLTQDLPNRVEAPADRRSLCYYYAIDGAAPVQDPVLLLNGEPLTESKPVNNVAFLSNVQEGLAPRGKSLASVTVVNPSKSEAELEPMVRKHLEEWFGQGEMSKWTLLKSYPISGAQPGQKPPNNFDKDVKLCNGVFCCGDHMDTPTLNGAFRSGVKAANAVASERGMRRKAILDSALQRGAPELLPEDPKF